MDKGSRLKRRQSPNYYISDFYSGSILFGILSTRHIFLMGQFHGKLLFYRKVMVIISDECCSEPLSHVCSAPSFLDEAPHLSFVKLLLLHAAKPIWFFLHKIRSIWSPWWKHPKLTAHHVPQELLSLLALLCLSTSGFSLILRFDLYCLQTKKHNWQKCLLHARCPPGCWGPHYKMAQH